MTAPTKMLMLARPRMPEDNPGSGASQPGEARGRDCRPPSRQVGGGSVGSETQHLQEVLDRWRAGDQAAADALCRRVARRFELLARKMIGRFHDVRVLADTDDVFQDAMMRLLHTLTKLRPATTRDFFNLAAVHLRRTLLDLTRRVA